MNSKITTSVLLGTFLLFQSTFSQTNDVTAGSTAVADTNAPAAATAPMSTAGTDTNAVAAVTDTNIVSSAPVPASTNTVATSIQLQDVPITTAIESLAHQAGINYLLDPKIGYGQPDKNGQIKTEPTLSIRWEHVTYEQALLALLDNYDLQLIEDKKTGIARITTKDPGAPPALVTRVVQLKYTGTSNMVEAVQSVFTDKRSRVLPDTRTSQLVVVGTQQEQDAVDMLIGELDKPTRQVLIETKLVEVSSNPSTKKGIDWSGTLSAQGVRFGNNVNEAGRYSTSYNTTTITTQNASTTNTSTLLQLAYSAPQALTSPGILVDTMRGFNPSTAFLDADGVSAVLSFLNSSADAQVMSTPRVVTLDNEMAMIQVTRGYPVFNVTASTAGVSTGSSTVAYTNVGTILYVTPRISANDYIYLKVLPEVSSFFGTVSKTIAGAVFQADEFDTRRVDTQVLIPNGNTLVLGGLVKDSPQANYTKVPILGDIPVLGYAFRSESKSLDKDNLLIFITPTIVKDSDFKPTTTDFLDSQPNAMKEPMNPHTWWDSSKPRGDWSNPAPQPNEFDKERL